jgi:tRNA(Ile2) C34 agmatinyltransferase TiaS
MIHLHFINKTCEVCGETYKGVQFDDNRCRYCERTYQIERIANALSHWVSLHD